MKRSKTKLLAGACCAAQRKRARWLEGQSRRYRRIHAFRHQLAQQQRRSVLFINQFW